MLQTIPRFRVDVAFADDVKSVWISDAHIENVLRQVSTMRFSTNPIARPKSITITEDEPPMQAGVTMASAGDS